MLPPNRVDSMILGIATDCVLYKDIDYHRGSSRGNGKDYTSVLGRQVSFPFVKVSDNNYLAPLPVHRRVYVGQAMGELAAFLAGHTNNNDFERKGCMFWKPWAGEDGSLGPIYGNQWLRQLRGTIDQLESGSRRAVVSAWNVNEIDEMVLPPCHFAFQLHRMGHMVSLTWFQRSCDVLVGLPYNLLSYWILNYLVSNEVGLEPYKVQGLLSDCHVYDNQIPSYELWETRNDEPAHFFPEIYHKDAKQASIEFFPDKIPSILDHVAWSKLNKADIQQMYKVHNYSPTQTLKFEVTV